MPFKLFSRIAERYDLANRLLSLGLDILWRKRLLSEVANTKPDLNNLLDIACGTGDVLVLAQKTFSEKVALTGLDPCLNMLKRAQKKLGKRAKLVRGIAEELPFKGEKFDAITVAFGVRNFSNRLKGLKEIRRVLKPRGVLGVLEFSPPDNGNLLSHLGWFYTEKVVPRLGSFITGDCEAYAYLSSSISKFPTPKTFTREVENIGFETVKVVKFLPSPTVLYIFVKQP